MMNSDTFRWLGTTVIAGLIAIIGILGTFLLLFHGKDVPEGIWAIDAAAVAGFIVPYGSMIGARASQNGQQIATNGSRSNAPHV